MRPTRTVAALALLVLTFAVFSVNPAAQNAALFLAAERGDVEGIERLVKENGNVNVAGDLRYGDRSYRVSAVGAAALGWHADAARTLLKHGAMPPQYVVRNHNLLPYSDRELDALRDWEVVNSVLRMPELAAITRPVVERDARGTYRTHDGQQYSVDFDDRGLRLTAPGGPPLRFQLVVGKAYMQILPAATTTPAAGASPPTATPSVTAAGAPSGKSRERTAAELAMFRRFVEPLPEADRAMLVEQFRDRGGIWLDFTVGEGRVLGLEIREGGPARLGGTPVLFRKVGIRPETSPLLEREVAVARLTSPPMNWPSFRGPGASGVADGQSPPIVWDAEKRVNIRWSTPIPGLGHASPIIWGDRIFLTTAVSSQPNPEFRPGGLRSDNVSTDRSEHEWRLIALDKGTGKILWQRTAHRGVPRGIRHLKSTFATPTPATNGTVIVAAFGSEGVFCYDMDGTLLWKKDLGVLGHFLYGFSASPVIYRDMVIIQADTNLDRKESTPRSFIAAFDLKDGSERWRANRDEDSRTTSSTPTVYEGLGPAQVVANGGSRIRSYDLATGKELWSLAAPSDLVTPTPVTAHNLIYVMSGGSGTQPMFAVRPNAVGDVTPRPGTDTNDFVTWSSTRGGSMTPTPLVYGDYIYSVNVSGVVGCYDALTGARKYLKRLEHGGSGFSASPIAADGRIYFPSEDGDVFVVKAGPTFELLSTNPMGEVIMASPAASGGMIFIRTLGQLVAVG